MRLRSRRVSGRGRVQEPRLRWNGSSLRRRQGAWSCGFRRRRKRRGTGAARELRGRGRACGRRYVGRHADEVRDNLRGSLARSPHLPGARRTRIGVDGGDRRGEGTGWLQRHRVSPLRPEGRLRTNLVFRRGITHADHCSSGQDRNGGPRERAGEVATATDSLPRRASGKSATAFPSLPTCTPEFAGGAAHAGCPGGRGAPSPIAAAPSRGSAVPGSPAGP